MSTSMTLGTCVLEQDPQDPSRWTKDGIVLVKDGESWYCLAAGIQPPIKSALYAYPGQAYAATFILMAEYCAKAAQKSLDEAASVSLPIVQHHPYWDAVNADAQRDAVRDALQGTLQASVARITDILKKTSICRKVMPDDSP